MEFHVELPYKFARFTFDYIRNFAAKVEELGFEGIFTPDHLILPEQFGSTYHIDGMYESLTTATFLATCTKRVRVGVLIIQPFRNPLEVATATATIDHISAGRLTVGFGAGYHKPEFDAFKADFGRRGLLEEESLQAILKLWKGTKTSFKGRLLTLEDVVPSIIPVQQPHPPIWIGGSSSPTIRRAAKFGQGWVPSHIDAKTFSDMVPRLKALLRTAKRPTSSFRYAVFLNCIVSDSYEGALNKAKILSKLWSIPVEKAEPRAIVGDVAHCSRRIQSYLDVGASDIVVRFLPFGNEFEDIKLFSDVIRGF